MSRATTTTGDTIGALSDEDRSELSGAAASAERAARPTHLLVLAGLLLVVAAVALLMSWTRLSSANRTLAFQMRLAEDMSADVAALKQLREASTSDGPTASDEVLTIRSRISQAAVGAGIKNASNLTPESDRANPQRAGTNSVQRLFKYTVQDEELKALLEWLHKAPQQVPGLEVYQMKLTPRATDWQLQVTFSRWERAKPRAN